MFSTCAQKQAKLKTISLSELEAWEKARQDRSDELQRRAAQRHKEKNMTKFQPGYGPAGKVPAYVEAHVLSLEASPFAQRVIFPGRRVRPCSAAATPNRSCATTAAKRESSIVNDRPVTAGSAAGGHSKTNHSSIGWGTPAGGGGCLAKHARHRKKRGVSASSALLFRPRQSVFDHDANTVVHHSRVRPATAPHSQHTTAPTTTLRGGRGFVAAGRKTRKTRKDDEDEDGGKEARLVETLANLAGVQRGSEFPTVTALKTAIAIKAVQKQLREYRLNRAMSQAAPVPELQSPRGQPVAEESTVSNVIPAGSRIRGSSSRVWRSGRMGRQQHEIEPWDNRTPFFGCNDSPSHTHSMTPGSPTSRAAPALRILTLHDPVFGYRASPTASDQRQELPGSSPLQPERRPTTPPSPSRGQREPTREHKDFARAPAAAAGASVAIAGTTDFAMAPSAQEMKMQACFRRLTVGALIELNHLRNPPKPVLAVLWGLACLLGWKRSNNPPTKNSRDGKHRHHHRPPRSLFSDTYLLRDILASISPRRIPSRRLSALAKRLGVPEAAPPKVRSANAAAAVLLEWLLAVVECARAS